MIEKVQTRYQTTHDFVKSLGSEWFIFKYEDIIAKNYNALNEYLGFEIEDDAKIPATTKKTKVARNKTQWGIGGIGSPRKAWNFSNPP